MPVPMAVPVRAVVEPSCHIGLHFSRFLANWHHGWTTSATDHQHQKETATGAVHS
jgi:hypothetical protein